MSNMEDILQFDHSSKLINMITYFYNNHGRVILWFYSSLVSDSTSSYLELEPSMLEQMF